MKSKTLTSKTMAFLLRHDKTFIFPVDGWRPTADLLDQLRARMKEPDITLEDVEHVVQNDAKGRFEFSSDKKLIRARYGHSVPVVLSDETTDVPDILYHGTAEQFLESICRQGIKAMRQCVHLTNDRMLALSSGARHGNPVLLAVDAKQMLMDNIRFWKGNDKIWLTGDIDRKYITPDEGDLTTG